MNISNDGIRKLILREDLRLKAYQDESGVWTIGVGHTRTARRGMVINEEEAHELLRDDLERFVRAVNRYVIVSLDQSQYDALVSFAFNIGVHGFKTSTLLRRLNAGLYSHVPEQMLRWNKATDPKTGEKYVSGGLVYFTIGSSID